MSWKMENKQPITEPDEIREHVVHVARQVFARYGFKKTALDDIAREAKRGKSTIYYYFKSKDDIFKAVVDAETDLMAKTIEDRIRGIDDPVMKIKTYVSARMLTLKLVANYYEAIKNDLLDQLYFVGNLRKNHLENEIKRVEKLLVEGIEKEVFRIQNPALTAKTIVTALHGFEVPLIVKNLSDEDIQKSVDEMLNILFFGIVAK